MFTISTGDEQNDPSPFHQDHRLEWHHLVDIISKKRLHWLQRSDEEITAYETWTQRILQEYVGADDYLAHVLFGWPVVEETSTEGNGKEMTRRKKVIVPSEKKGNLVLKMNDFPYSVEQGIIHYCLWCDAVVDEEQVKRYTETTFPHHETVWWINPPSRKTIKSIWHAHILVRFRA